jgi:low affinity Fe/Cu permease
VSDLFSQAAHWTGRQCGRASVFMAAVVLIIAWAGTGPFFHYSDTWQLIINTGTTIITFLMVFLLQNTQNRDTAAIQLKLDELIRANQDARNAMLCLEDLSEDELRKVKATFESLATSPAGHVRRATEQLEDAGNTLHAVAKFCQTTQEPFRKLEGARHDPQPHHPRRSRPDPHQHARRL